MHSYSGFQIIGSAPLGVRRAQVDSANGVVGKQLLATTRSARPRRSASRSPDPRVAAPASRPARRGAPRRRSARSASSTAKISAMTLGASPSDGSSSSSSVGPLIRARPTASICCSPPESVAAACAERSAEHREERRARARGARPARWRLAADGGWSTRPARGSPQPSCSEKSIRPSGTSASPSPHEALRSAPGDVAASDM